MGPKALAAGSQPGRWPGDHAPEKGHAPFRSSLAQQIVAHRRCTKEPMTACLCQEVGGKAGAWDRAWSEAGDSWGIAPRWVPRREVQQRESVEGKRKETGTEKNGVCGHRATEIREAKGKRHASTRHVHPSGASVYPLGSVSAIWDSRDIGTPTFTLGQSLGFLSTAETLLRWVSLG